MSWPFGDLQMFGYDIICADPPWQFERWSDKNQSKGAADQYDLMPLDAIKALPVGQLAAKNCLLLMWTCGWAIATGQAQEVAKAWGFDPITELVWRKVTRTGKVRMGTGYWARTIHEPILLCTTGSMRIPAFPSLFDGVAREHSRKPDQFYDLVKARTIGMRRADLFSRESRVGFEGWGNEHGKFDSGKPVEDINREEAESPTPAQSALFP